MPFLDSNSHLTTKPYNFDIKCQSNSESYDQHGFFGDKFRGGQNFLITVGGFYNEREYSVADWLVLLVLFGQTHNLTKKNLVNLVSEGVSKIFEKRLTNKLIEPLNIYVFVEQPPLYRVCKYFW